MKKNCKQNLDSYCPDNVGLENIHFLYVLTAQKALKYVQRWQLNCFAVAMHPGYDKSFKYKSSKTY